MGKEQLTISAIAKLDLCGLMGLKFEDLKKYSSHVVGEEDGCFNSAIERAEKYCMQHEFLASFLDGVNNGLSVEDSIYGALSEWDI